MKLPWNKQYLVIAFHVIVTLVVLVIAAVIVINFHTIWFKFFYWVGKIISALKPVIIGFVVAYLFDPLVDFFQGKFEWLMEHISTHDKFKKITRKRTPYATFKKRIAGTAITYIAFVAFIGLMFFMLIKSVSSSTGDMGKVVTVIESTVNGFNSIIDSITDRLSQFNVSDQIRGYIENATSQITSFLETFVVNAVSSITTASGVLLNILLGLTIGFYMLVDKYRALNLTSRLIRTFIPEKYYLKIHNVTEDVNAIFSGYIRGQLMDAAIMAVLISAALMLIGVKFPIVIGIISGALNVIPYFGAFIAFFLAVAVSLLSGNPLTAVFAAIAILVLQQIDGIFIVPKVVGERVKLHPALVIISITVAASIFGLLGMILAVPIVAIAKLFLTRFVRRRAKKYY